MAKPTTLTSTTFNYNPPLPTQQKPTHTQKKPPPSVDNNLCINHRRKGTILHLPSILRDPPTSHHLPHHNPPPSPEIHHHFLEQPFDNFSLVDQTRIGCLRIRSDHLADRLAPLRIRQWRGPKLGVEVEPSIPCMVACIFDFGRIFHDIVGDFPALCREGVEAFGVPLEGLCAGFDLGVYQPQEGRLESKRPLGGPVT